MLIWSSDSVKKFRQKHADFRASSLGLRVYQSGVLPVICCHSDCPYKTMHSDYDLEYYWGYMSLYIYVYNMFQ